MARLWNENWELVAQRCGLIDEYPLNDDLLKEIIIKLYRGNYGEGVKEHQSFIGNMSRKLIKDIIYGNYGAHAVVYSLEGSPPKGCIFVFPYYGGEIYFYKGNMKRLIAQKYQHVAHAFITDANNFVKAKKNEKDREIMQTIAVKKEEESDNFYIYLKIEDMNCLNLINWIDNLKLIVKELDAIDKPSTDIDNQILLFQTYLGQILCKCNVVTLTSDDYERPIPLDEIGMREIKYGAIFKD